MRFLNSAREATSGPALKWRRCGVATQPFPRYTAGMNHAEAVAFLHKLNDLAAASGFSLNIGPSMLKDNDDASANAVLAEALSTGKMNGSLVIAGDDGIHWRAVRESAKVIQTISRKSAGGEGNFNFAASAMVQPYGPFPGAYHLGGARTFAVGLEGAVVVADVFAQYHDPVEAEKRLSEALAKWTRQAEAVAISVAGASGWVNAGIDPTPAPLEEVSIGRAMESLIGGPFGSSGAMTAARIITAAVQSVPVKRTGYSGLMVPVLEDAVLARRWAEGTYTLDSLLAYSAECAGGLDTIPLAGDTGEERIAHILSDVASLAYKWKKPLAARLMPVPGKKADDRTQFTDSRMQNTVIR